MEQNKSNVIMFPRQPDNPVLATEEQLAEAVKNMRLNFIDVLGEDIMQTILFRAHIEGFDLTTEKCTTSIGLSVEAVKAALMKSVDIDHFLHDVADKLVTVVDEVKAELDDYE